MKSEQVFVEDQWLGSILGKPVWNLVDPTVDSNLPSNLNSDALISTRVPVNDTDTTQKLEEAGFKLVDTNVQLEIATAAAQLKIHTYCEATPLDEGQVVDLAARSFRSDRFHLDPKIPNTLAAKIKACWARNFFRGRRGDFMLIARGKGGLEGFLLLVKRGTTVATIDLIAVESSCRRTGVVESMIRSIFGYCHEQKIDRIRVGTQMANRAAINLYIKLGFRVVSSDYTFHYHRK